MIDVAILVIIQDTLVELKKNDKGKKIYRGKSKINIAPKKLIEIFKYDLIFVSKVSKNTVVIAFIADC